MKITVFLLILALFTSCQTSTVYQQATQQGFGYSDKKLDEKLYQVTFKGNSTTDRETVERYLIYRIAQLTESEGFQFFKVLSKDTKTLSKIYEDYIASPMHTPYVTGFYRQSNFYYPYYSYGYPWSYGFRSRIDVRRRYEAVAFVKTYKKKPKTNDKIQNASQVLKSLEDKISFPKKNK